MFGFNNYLNLFTYWPSVLIITLISIYFYSTRNHKYWSSRGVKGPKPWPFIGNLYQIFSKPRCVYEVDNYKKFGKIYGLYVGSKPVLSVAEPELIKDIAIKDFHKFVDRGSISLGDPIFDRSVLIAKGEEWKQIRTIVSPTFSSNKMKKMQILIKECVHRLDKQLEKYAKSGEELNIRQVMVNYTMDVIALCAFATEIDTHNTGAEEHPFIKNAQVFFKPSMRFGFYFLFNAIIPSMVKKYKFTFVSKDVIDYFKSALRTIIAERETQKVSKNIDFLQLLIDAKNKSDSKDIDEDIKLEVKRISESMKRKGFQLEEIDILSTALIFILAGYETTASTLSNLFHELAMNPECQQRLFEEITSYGSDVDYDTIGKMSFLESCVSETLRMYSPLVMTQRNANEDYDLGDTGLVIPKGMSVQIPIYAIQHDPQYFPNPNVFNPNRFMPENKDRLIPYTYLPFGTGPRNCVGMRFALMNIKTAVVSAVTKYQFIRTKNTKTEFKYKKFVVFTQPLDMGTVGLKPRK